MAKNKDNITHCIEFEHNIDNNIFLQSKCPNCNKNNAKTNIHTDTNIEKIGYYYCLECYSLLYILKNTGELMGYKVKVIN